MKPLRLPALLAAMVTLALPVAAHEVQVRQQAIPLTVVTLTYADGKPFAFEQFEITPQGADRPSQVGRTDGAGRAAILPVAGKALELVATSKDGHGTRLTLPVDASSAVPPAPTFVEPPRWIGLAAGAGILFGLFGLFQIFQRPRKSGP
jgi:nickel transport protein